jgi:nitrite reductase/ring-hydroxylating ferredoxin subunit
MIECPWHGGRFNIRTGTPTGPPVKQPICTYRAELLEKEVWIEVAEVAETTREKP